MTKGALGSRRTRAAWGIGDQLLYALSNAGLTFIAAHFLGVNEFGRFALLFTTIAMILGVCRAMTSEPYTVLTGTENREEQQRAVPPTLGLAVVLGLLCGAPLIAAGLFFDDPLFLVFGIAAAPIVWQDAVRYLLIAHRRIRAAFVNDFVWLTVQFAATALVIVFREPSAAAFAACWAIGAAVGCAFSVVQLASFPSLRRAGEWWRRSRRYSSYYVLEFMALAGSGLSIVYVVALTSGMADAGAYRGAQALLGPIGVLDGGLRMLALPSIVRRRAEGREVVVRVSTVAGGGLAGVTLLVVLALWATGDLFGPFLLGATAVAALPLIVPIGLGRTATSGAAGALLGMRALGVTRRSLGARLAVAALTLVLAAVGATAWGALGAAWGYAVASGAGLIVWYVMLRRSRLVLGSDL